MGPPLAEIQQKIGRAVEANWQRQIDWLQRLASFPSTRGHEANCQNWVASEFGSRGWSVDSYTLCDVAMEGLPGYSPAVDVDYAKAVQVVATLEPDKSLGKSLILQGHIDVVPPGAPEHWDHPPFEPRIDGNIMLGRGVNDMKVGVAEMVFALEALRDAGLKPAAKVFVETVSEEECTGNGALSTLVRGYTADACLIPEAMGNKLVRAQLGSVWFRLRILGQPAHLLEAASGSSAILSAYDYIAALQGLAYRYNEEAKTDRWFCEIDTPVGFSAGKIRGGDWLGSVPSWCEIDCRLNVLPGHELADVRNRIAETVGECTLSSGAHAVPEISWIGFQAEAYVLDPGSAAEGVLAASHKAVFGSDLEAICLTATSDIRQYGLYYGIPSLCYGSKGSGSHSNTEQTDLISMRETTKAIALFIANWCGVTDA